MFCTWIPLNGQLTQRDYSPIDRYAQKAPDSIEKDLDSLCHYLISPYNHDWEKSRSIFAWIIHHISYDNFAYKKGVKRINKSNQDILRRRKAVCFGYACLFKEMAEVAGIESKLVSGYSKQILTSTTDIKKIDHAWNAVKLDGQWYLLDATWDSSLIYQDDLFTSAYQQDYYLTPPNLFILTHLPNDPMWQLLDCPISKEDFKQSSSFIESKINGNEKCFSYKDSIEQFLSLRIENKRITEALNSFEFNPNEENRKQLGHSYIDYAASLSEKAEQFQENGQKDSLLVVYPEIIRACEKANFYATLYAWQKELYANTHFNFAISLSFKLEKSKSKSESQNILLQMLKQLEKAKEILSEIPKTITNSYLREMCQDYIKRIKSDLERY